MTKSRRRFPRTEIEIEISEVDRFRTLKNDSSAFSLLSKFEKQNTGTRTRPDAERAGELNARHGQTQVCQQHQLKCNYYYCGQHPPGVCVPGEVLVGGSAGPEERNIKKRSWKRGGGWKACCNNIHERPNQEICALIRDGLMQPQNGLDEAAKRQPGHETGAM